MKEPIIVVDQNDEPLGYAERSSIDYHTQIYRVAALWLVSNNGFVLIAQRMLTKQKDPGLWGPSVAGTVERDETYEQNIVKESYEEIGLEDVTFHPVKKVFVKEPRQYFCQWFIGKTDWTDTANFKLQDDEVEAIAWIKPEDLRKDFEKSPQKYIPSFSSSLAVLEEAMAV